METTHQTNKANNTKQIAHTTIIDSLAKRHIMKKLEDNKVKLLMARYFTDIEVLNINKALSLIEDFLNSDFLMVNFFAQPITEIGDMSMQQAFNKIKMSDWLLVLEKKRFLTLLRHHHTIYLSKEDCMNAAALAGIIIRKTMYQLNFKSEFSNFTSVPNRMQNLFFKWFMKQGR